MSNLTSDARWLMDRCDIGLGEPLSEAWTKLRRTIEELDANQCPEPSYHDPGIERLAIDLDNVTFGMSQGGPEHSVMDGRTTRDSQPDYKRLPTTLSPRCGCKVLCGDKPETSDHPYAVCKSLPR